MSMTEAIGRIQSIESMLQQLTQGIRPQASAAASGTANPSAGAASSTDAASFAQALSTAVGGSTTPEAGQAAFSDALGGSTAISGASGLGIAGLGIAGLGSSLAALSGAATPKAASGVTGDAVAADAKKYVGVPYVWGGTNPAVGMDCSGFVQRVFKDLGVDLPRVVSDQMRQGTPVASLAQAKPGDLLVSFGGEHISIYLGNGKAIDAPVPGKTIQIRDAWEQQSNLTAIRRIVPAGGS